MEYIMTTELIDLQSANATQLSNNGVKGAWSIKKNISGELLQVLPATVSDELVFTILDFAKKYELIAFNAGIKFQKGKENEVLSTNIIELKHTINELITENNRLADILESQIN